MPLAVMGSWQAWRGKRLFGHFQLPTVADIYGLKWAIPHSPSSLGPFIANQLCEVIEEADPFSWFVGRYGCDAGDNIHSWIINGTKHHNTKINELNTFQEVHKFVNIAVSTKQIKIL